MSMVAMPTDRTLTRQCFITMVPAQGNSKKRYASLPQRKYISFLKIKYKENFGSKQKIVALTRMWNRYKLTAFFGFHR